jgi:hypothetical protein
MNFFFIFVFNPVCAKTMGLIFSIEYFRLFFYMSYILAVTGTPFCISQQEVKSMSNIDCSRASHIKDFPGPKKSNNK